MPSTNESTESLNDSSPKALEAKKRRRFSADTANDLLFWGIHLCIVAISLGIIWLKVDSLTQAIRQILMAEERANTLLAQELRNAEAATIVAQQAERTRSIQLTAATNLMDGVMRQVTDIQTDIKATLAKTNEINRVVLTQSEATKAAAVHSEQAAQNAVGAANQAAATAGSAAGAASRAAAISNRTGNVVASKVVTAADKRSLAAQERALAAKQKQLAKTIKQVKKRGPTLLQQIFH
jgi:hypothetical protein